MIAEMFDAAYRHGFSWGKPGGEPIDSLYNGFWVNTPLWLEWRRGWVESFTLDLLRGGDDGI